MLLIIAVAFYGLPLYAASAAAAAPTIQPISDQTPGSSVTVQGTAEGDRVSIQIFQPDGALFDIDSAAVANGEYSYSVLLPEQAKEGAYKVVVGRGEDVATVTFDVAKNTPPTGTGNTSGSGSSAAGSEIVVNGKAQQAGKLTTRTVNNRVVSTVVVDSRAIEDLLASEGQNVIITIPVKAGSDAAIGQLNGSIVPHLVQKQAVIELQTEQASYKLPVSHLDFSSLAAALRADVPLDEIQLQIEISNPDADMTAVVRNAAEDGEFEIVVPPLHFTVRAVHGDQTVEASKFGAFVERLIEIPDGVDPDRVTTAVVVDPDGSVRHVPTRIVEVDGRYYAQIQSMTNSVYTLIWNPITFSDMAGHWAEAAVNDMGSRKVVNGTGQGRFSPDQAITRAEFAAIVVRGLGLKLAEGSSSFSDVAGDAWYSDAVHTAYSSGLISGYQDGTFRPDSLITREEAMTIIARAMKLTELKSELAPASADEVLRTFTDASEVSNWAVSGVADCIQSGIVSGRSVSLLAPGAQMTRAELATIVERLLRVSGLI